MDHNSIIDRNTFEVTLHAEDHKDVFICDKEIANALALLNKKGYKTIASCSGHYKIEFYEYLKEDISKLEEYKNNNRMIIKEIREKDFDYWQEVDKTIMYILFDKKYNFNNLPKGFELDNTREKTCVEYIINFYDENNKHRTIKDVTREIESKSKELKEWVKLLPRI